jgi:hypothetical protein
MNKLIEIAKANGGKRWNGNDDRDLPSIILTDDQLRATVEQVCAPLVEALQACKRMSDADNPDSYRCDDSEGALDSIFSKSDEAFGSYRALIGDKHE